MCASPPALVDALSAPIQAMSQAEKRAKQMAEMGIDESDISDVPIVSNKNKKAVEKKDSSQTNGKQPGGKAGGAPVSKTNSTPNATAAPEKKKEKGDGTVCILSH